MQNKVFHCPKCGGILVFLIATDDTLVAPQCENGYGHLSLEQEEGITTQANIEYGKEKESFANEWVGEMKRLLTLLAPDLWESGRHK